MPKLILITGVSSGLGRAMAGEALARGHRVVGTVRHAEAGAAFEALAPGRALARRLDLADTGAIAPLVREVETSAGAIDAVVNNAGYGLEGAVEELSLPELRAQFEINVFAPVAMIQAVLPFMRARRRGHVLNVTSMGAVVTFPGLGAYHGSKFALQGLSDTLAAELEPFGIRVTSILPGVYRSDWGGRSLRGPERRMSEYEHLHDPSRREALAWGDPAALGRVVLDAIEMPEPPRRLPVGPTALAMIRDALAGFGAEIDRWQELAFADGEG
ncbi:oxidoreductase [Rhizosaccharibacter radicis]|uniref:Oxidoreductase n=1 Tax=Rhizosaccharibacter radicis TaxID=2782605 RepID=A0ABT1W1H3_9PROT|nr:oxidoreductase [Acetobacteraceae bacterium KSS12]